MFGYSDAFSRNIGWLTRAEQGSLANKCIAIAGMGGVGGNHLLTLARLGVGRFHIADFDTFEIHNFNRQVGATVSHLGRSKVQVLAEMARDINPELEIRTFPEGVTEANVSDFLSTVDVYVDGLDFFAFSARSMTFDACAEAGIPVVTAAPLGMGAAVVNFMPGECPLKSIFAGGKGRTKPKPCAFCWDWPRPDCTSTIWWIPLR
ncbi:MAG: ThiF family adenylyltransferase [Ferrovum myxofaciens]